MKARLHGRGLRYATLVAGGLLLAASGLSSAWATKSADPAVEPARTQPRFLPDLETLALHGERAIFDPVLAQLGSDGPESARSMIETLDRALAQLDQPTRLRGFVQFLRSSALMRLGRSGEAFEAIEDSIRLLPGYSGPLLAASTMYGFNNQADIGAAHLIRASRIDPVTVRTVDDYYVSNLIRRLEAVHDEGRVRALSDSLLDIHWMGRRLASQSRLARSAIERRVADGNIDGARALVPKLIVPEHSHSLLVNRSYAQLWPDIEKWAGERLEKQWPLYLSEARERWTSKRDSDSLADYTTALADAGDDETIIRDILPLFFSRPLDPKKNDDLLFVVSPVAGALARSGRWGDVERLFERVSSTWPLGSQPNALNAAANRARYLLYADQPQAALTLMDLAIADARKWGAQVNVDAMASMHHYRACMLHALGRSSEAGASLAYAVRVADAAEAARLQLCTGNRPGARDALLQGLDRQTSRDEVILFMQPPSNPPASSAYGRRMRAAEAELRSNPELVAAVAKYGRILPFAVSAAAPRSTAG